MSEASDQAQTGWRIPRACQECRKRKIKCNGLAPCKSCQLRNTPCIYRDYIRHRRKKHEYKDPIQENPPRQGSLSLAQPSGHRPSVMHDFPNSVSATHMASSSCQMQLYYGPTSNFSLMQHIYRDLVSNPTAKLEPSGEVEEAGAGLDLFSFRRIFFGTPDSHEGSKPTGPGAVVFLPYDLAKIFLSRYLSTLYHMMPHRPKSYYEECLERLYNSCPTNHLDISTQAILLLAMATASLGTDHFAWGDVLFERVKALYTPFDDMVNLQTIQISFLMISCPPMKVPFFNRYGNFQNEQGRPNSAFLHLGSAARKALSAGLHKDVPYDVDQTAENIEERRVTFWSVYIYETWFCFHSGRPSSLSLKDVAIEFPQDPFIRLLVNLCKTITRSTDEIYGQRHESLLHMWKVARSIVDDLRGVEAHLKQGLGFGLDAAIQTGSLGVRQTIFNTLYYHTILLTFRPFLIFRGYLQRDIEMSLNQSNTNATNRPTETPPWLNEACKHAITATQKTLHHLVEASKVNDLVRQLRYHGYFLGNSTFTLIYDFLHDANAAPVHLPWVYVSLQCLSTMRAGDPITSTISAVQTVLREINPSYEWSPYPTIGGGQMVRQAATSQYQPGFNLDHSNMPMLHNSEFPQNTSLGSRPDQLTSPWNLPQLEFPETGGSVALEDDLLDFTQADMGWDFDFSTMDLESFFSVYQSNDPQTF
ncbi:hypothetical protein N7467_008149 [Penicillium canescens]|nr:hypothetical protein N7467_008149 [Penicillium canescens]